MNAAPPLEHRAFSSDAQTERRRELEMKLARDVEGLELLRSSLDKTNKLTDQMQTMLASFDSRLSKLENFIIPIHRSTQKLTRLHTNIDVALAQIASFTSTFDVIKKHEAVVRKGLQDIDLQTYLESISKLKESLQSLEATKYKSSERSIQALKDTLWKGIRQLDERFAVMLTAACDAVEPSSCQSDEEAAQAIPDDKLLELQRLAGALAVSLVEIGPISAFIKQYEELRSAHYVKVLAGINQSAKDQELKSANQRATYQKGTSLLVPYSATLLRILNTEHALHLKIIPKHHAVTTFVQTITAAVDGFLDVCESMLNRVRRHIQRRETNDIFMLIDVWHDLSQRFEKHTALLAYCGKKGHEIELLLNNCSTVVTDYFRETHDELKAESEKKLSALSVDGTVHETTSMTMNTLKRLLDFVPAMEHLISSCQSKSTSFIAANFQNFVSKMVEALLIDVDIKSKGYKKPTLTTLFLLNNNHYILKGVKGSKLAESITQETMDSIEKSIKKQLDVYRNSWMPLIEHLMDTTKISEQGRIVMNLSKQQREVIKEKFKNFNKEFDDMFLTQKAYAIPDVELRAQVVKEVKQVLLPMYNRFHDRYTEVEFTKNPEKYIKYSKEELAATLDKFFDASS